MKRTKYPVHPDFKKWENTYPVIHKAVLPVMQKLMGQLVSRERSSAEIAVAEETVPVGNGSTVRALLYTPAGTGENAPCLVYFHGGGFVFPAAPHHFSLAREYALRTPCKVLFVNYRLAPKYPFPAAPEDCFAAYCRVLAEAGRLSVDPSRVAVAGDSAGGGLAAAVCLMARERGRAMPCGQMLLYPFTGRNPQTASMKKYTDTPMCSSRDIEKYTALYIRNPTSGKREYASPIDAGSFGGLPEAYIETAEFDCLRDGGILYAERLREYGVPAELHNTEGTIHGFDIALSSGIVRACVGRRILFLKRIFGIKE